MNKCLFQIGENQYQVVNEKGETYFTVANKNGSEDILIKENELENSKKKLNDDEESLQVNTIKCILGEASMFIVMPGLIGLAFAYTTLPIAAIFSVLAYVSFKALHVGAFGTRTKRLKERKNLKAEIKQLKSDIPELENMINQAKKDIEFKRYYIKNKETNENTVTIVSNYAYSTDEEIKEENHKVLSIGQKR